MKLTFVSPHKSITPFRELDLPDFVVLTGVNGAGKSHLLEAIENGCVRIDDIETDSETKPIRRFDWTNLIPQESIAVTPSQIAQERYQYWQEIFSGIEGVLDDNDYLLNKYKIGKLNKLSSRKLVTLSNKNISRLLNESEPVDDAYGDVYGVFLDFEEDIIKINDELIYKFTNRSKDIDKKQLVRLLQEKSSHLLITFEEQYFYENFPVNWVPIDIFQQSFSRLFSEYQSNWLDNQSKLLTSSDSEEKPEGYLLPEEFVDKYGEKPWDFVNKVLETANIDFKIDKLPEYKGSPYVPILTDRTRDTEVKFTDLSSGEKVLMSFALCLYYARDHRQLVNYPKILLFDEIDAPLHPSMTQSLLRIIREVLIDRHKIKVILTTHSPSTVALSEESSIYAMYKDGNHRLKKVKKDTALAILTNGVPTLSISYENRRQVFVESEYDVQFYEQIYQKLKNELSSEISLNFISSGSGDKGGCDRVRTTVNDLWKHGNKTVYGIIDWDLKNEHTDRVKVLGQGNRYSIENYIFDPVILAAFLLLEGCITREMIGLEQNETYFDLPTFDNERLQVVANFILDKLKVLKLEDSKEETKICEYSNRKAVDLPLWFLEIQGHHLEDTLKNIFNGLKKYKREADLKKAIINKIIDHIPLLIPMDFISLFKEIQ
jgi:ABC-type branched-subunit amino acid transport system ATPase component